VDSREMPSSRLFMYRPSARETTATSRVAFTGTRRVGCTLRRKPGSCRSRAIANSSREVAAWATSELAKPHATAVAIAVSVDSQAPPATAAAS
jgi:hypothetical protein